MPKLGLAWLATFPARLSSGNFSSNSSLIIVYQLLSLFQASIPDRLHYRPGWQRNPTLVKMHEKYKEENVSNGSRIVGGTEVIPHSFPHQVAMFIDGSFFCGGSLICKQVLARET